MLSNHYAVISPAEAGVTLDVEETGRTFRENAILKAEAGLRASGMLTIADDSGLEIDALDGAPGIFSARYGGAGKSDRDRVALVLERMRGIPPEDRTARFTAAIAVAAPGTPVRTVGARVEGIITEAPRGSGEFGYDPIFLYPPAGKTFAEMDAVEKGQVSHRGMALRKVPELLERG